MIYSLQRREEIPPIIISLANDACKPGSPYEDAQYALFQLVTQVCTLRSQEHQGTHDPIVLLDLAFSIDSSLEHWASNLPEELNFSIQIDATGTSLDGYYHIYANPSDARLWSFYRSARILVNSSISRLLNANPHLSTLLPGKDLQALSVIAKLSADICASVPYFLLADENDVAGMNGKNFVWPLYAVATQSGVTVRVRCWIIEQLKGISVKSGLLQGLAVADVLSRTWEIWDWRRGVDGGEGEGEMAAA
jgi:hypothetical protein